MQLHLCWECDKCKALNPVPSIAFRCGAFYDICSVCSSTTKLDLPSKEELMERNLLDVINE
jgi:hypothetical protein